MSVATEPVPAVVDGYDEAQYHAHPALSSSGARRLLPPSCPAKFKWERDNGRPEKRTFDFGHAAHGLVLGVGMDLTVVDAPDWRTKAAQASRDAAYADGQVPLLKHEWEQVSGMARALAADPVASQLFAPGEGCRTELSLFWHDQRHEVDRRARLDWLPEVVDGRAVIVDYKTAADASPRAVAKSVHKYGYHQQGAWYVDGALATGLADEVGFLLVFQEKTAPYLVTVVEPDQQALQVGRALNDRALEVFAECSATGIWPGYSSEIETVSLPAWALNDFIGGTA